MPGWEMKIIEAEAERLLSLAAGDADLRAELRALAQVILAATEEPPPSVVPAEGSHPDPAPALPDADEAQAVPSGGPRGPEPLHELTLGRSRPVSVERHPPSEENGGSAFDATLDFDEIEARCRLKAEAARHAAARLRRLRGGGDPGGGVAPVNPEVASWADRFTDAFSWRDDDDGTQPPDISLLDDLGGCFEALAGASALAAGDGERRGALGRSLHLLAEAQSAVRSATQHLQAPDDPDQLAAYEWARDAATRHRVFIKRYLRADDLADPARWPDLLARIEAQAGGDPRARRHRPRVKRLRRHLEAIRRGDDADRDWQEVVEAVDEMVAEGLPPSSKDLRDLLLPAIDDLPDRDDPPEGFRLVLREIDRYLASRADPTEAPVTPEPTPEVQEARRLLGGRSIVLLGGMCRPEARAALREALGLADLVWVETKEHQAVSTFEPVIARPEVALVLLAIRWSSHAFGEVRRYCDLHGTPLVRLPGGYNPNQVAAQIIDQCGERLRGG
ncbi:hypothetical protein [Tautonia plasticadhaerens]|uniref:DUF2325 domain-containing protein n=1 Tax=Tautonia plasticadhaerens TaxID=2527974 RepID=A0A518H0M6_9BACT|nr:hypothetical protein [Tautonia plasticadhaerens]QDV34378.1 hypothetical protein ElP_22630 [Tautonia plasticadhaerens]